MSNTEQRIECDGRLIARKTEHGIKVWCDKHKHEKLLTWAELGVQPIPIINPTETLFGAMLKSIGPTVS